MTRTPILIAATLTALTLTACTDSTPTDTVVPAPAAGSPAAAEGAVAGDSWADIVGQGAGGDAMRGFMADLSEARIGANANELAILAVYATGLCEKTADRNLTDEAARRHAVDELAVNGIVLDEEEAEAFVRSANMHLC
ncbi:hypothetical protein [Rhodococcus phenolicus]|uniref:hypothetical protein n=1 Tax=Rhodococcus phenolicus TaxID=263849 RepID=UPI0008377CA5|nr:hypothetical protein [Rhodococcus phenolicus]